MENSGGQIVSKGVVLIDSLGDMTLEGKIEGLEGTKIEANTLTTREIINNKATLELIGRNGVVLNNDITAKILSIESGSNLDINNKIHGEDGLSLKAKDITNKNEITSGDYLYIKSDGRLENTQNGLIYSVGDQILEGQVIENNRGRIISNGSLSLIGDSLVRNNVGNIHSNGDMYIQVSNGNFENIGHTQTIIDEVISRVQVKNTPQSLKGRLKSQQQGENNTELLTVTRTERLGATESSSLTSSGNITIIGKDIHNTEGSIIKSDKDIQIQGENLYNTSTAVRNNNDITLVKGSTIEGNEVILDISQRIINGFYDLGGMDTRNDGILIDHRTGVQTQLAKIAGVNGTYILAGDFENRGIIGAGGTTYIDSKNRVINENVGNLNTGQILGEAVAIEGANGVRNIGGLIRGEKAVQITSANGQVLNESTIYSNATYTNPTAEKSNSFLKIAVKTNNQGLNKITEGLKNIGRIESNGQVYIDADSIRNVGGIIAGNEGTYLKAKTDIEDTSISLRSLDHNVVEDGRKWDTVDRTVNVSGQIGNGGDTILSAGRDILLINSDLRASNDIVLNAKRYITSLSVLDTEYRYAQTTETKKKSFGRKKTTVKTWIEDNEYANGTQMTAGRHILMNYVGTGTDDTQVEQIKNQGIFLQGADLLAQGEIVGMSDGNIYTQGTRDKLGSFYEEKTSKSILGFSYSKSRDTVDSSQERYKLTQMYAGAGISYDSEGKLIVEGADIQTAGNLYLRGKQGVYLLPGTEDGYRREEHVKEGLTANFDVGRASVSAGVGYEKNKDTLTEVTTNIVNNQIQVGGNYYAKSEEGDYTHIATNLLVDGDMKIDAKNINILDAQAYRKIHQTSERTYVGVGVTVGVPIVESAYQIKDSYEALEGAKGTEGYINAGFQGLNTYFGAVSALANPIGVSGSITASYSKSEYNREESISVGSNIIVKGSTEFNGENLHIRGSNLQVGENLTYNITNDIVIEAGKSTLKEDGKSVGYGVSIGKGMLGENGLVNPFKDNNMTVTPSISQQKSTTTGEFYNNSQVYAAGNTHYNVGGDLTVKGGNVETGTISGKIAGNVTIESVQDKIDSKSQGFSASYGIGLGEHYTTNDGNGKNPWSGITQNGQKVYKGDGVYTSSIGLGYNQSTVEQRMTTTPSSFVAGAGELEVGNKVKQVGSLIDGGFTLNTKEYEVENVKDINKAENFGINLTIYPKIAYKDIVKLSNGMEMIRYASGNAIGTQLQYGSKDYEAINQATIGKNIKVLIEGKETDLSGINRDVENMVKVTKDKTVEQIDINLGSENWLTDVGRTTFNSELFRAKENVGKAYGEIVNLIEKIKNKEEVVKEITQVVYDSYGNVDYILIKGKKVTKDSQIAEYQRMTTELANSLSDDGTGKMTDQETYDILKEALGETKAKGLIGQGINGLNGLSFEDKMKILNEIGYGIGKEVEDKNNPNTYIITGLAAKDGLRMFFITEMDTSEGLYKLQDKILVNVKDYMDNTEFKFKIAEIDFLTGDPKRDYLSGEIVYTEVTRKLSNISDTEFRFMSKEDREKLVNVFSKDLGEVTRTTYLSEIGKTPTVIPEKYKQSPSSCMYWSSGCGIPVTAGATYHGDENEYRQGGSIGKIYSLGEVMDISSLTSGLTSIVNKNPKVGEMDYREIGSYFEFVYEGIHEVSAGHYFTALIRNTKGSITKPEYQELNKDKQMLNYIAYVATSNYTDLVAGGGIYYRFEWDESLAFRSSYVVNDMIQKFNLDNPGANLQLTRDRVIGGINVK